MMARIDEYSIGQKYEKEFTVTEEMGEQFAKVSSDYNEIHLNEEYAKNTQFKGRIVHGMLVASFISGVIGNDFPGSGTIYLGQDLKFLFPVRYNDTIRVEVEVGNIVTEKSRLELNTCCYNQNGEMVISGKALVKVI